MHGLWGRPWSVLGALLPAPQCDLLQLGFPCASARNAARGSLQSFWARRQIALAAWPPWPDGGRFCPHFLAGLPLSGRRNARALASLWVRERCSRGRTECSVCTVCGRMRQSLTRVHARGRTAISGGPLGKRTITLVSRGERGWGLEGSSGRRTFHCCLLCIFRSWNLRNVLFIQKLTCFFFF